jgi:MipA family protein
MDNSMKIFKKMIYNFLTILIFLFIFKNTVYSEQNGQYPLWEFGLFNAAARLPHYRGSNEYKWYVLPLPYIIYRGDIIRANREGVRGIFYGSEYIETSISLYGNPPVSSDNKAREGMSDLDAIFEIGPAIKWYVFGRHPMDSFYLRFALRAANSIDFDHGVDISYQGLRSSLHLFYFNRSSFQKYGISYGLNTGIDFSNSRLHSYFYDVKQEEVRPGRPYFKSDSGYSGFSLAGALQKKLTHNLSLGFYLRWDNISSAVYKDSPLVNKENNYIIGTALIWKITESKKQVSFDDQ